PAAERWQLGDEVSSPPKEAHTTTATPFAPMRHSRSGLLLFSAVSLSLLAHFFLLQLQFPLSSPRPVAPEPPPQPQEDIIEVMSEPSPAPVLADQAELHSLQVFHTSAIERTTALEQLLLNAQSQQKDLTVSHQQEVEALEATRSSLSG